MARNLLMPSVRPPAPSGQCHSPMRLSLILCATQLALESAQGPTSGLPEVRPPPMTRDLLGVFIGDGLVRFAEVASIVALFIRQ